MIFSILQFIKYYFKSVTKFKIHSPFVYDFIINVLEKNISIEKKLQVNKLKISYKNNNQFIRQEDYGAGSKISSTKNGLSTKSLLKNVAIKNKYGKILHNLVNFYQVKTSIELGTSLGIGTAYLNSERNKIISIEGNKDLAKLTKLELKNNKFKNIEIINAKFDEVYENILKKEKSYDVIFIDGNHTEEATLKYFKTALKYKNKNSIIIFDDIYWSQGMKNAWTSISTHKEVMLSIDLYKLGIIFFNKDFMTKEHFTLWY